MNTQWNSKPMNEGGQVYELVDNGAVIDNGALAHVLAVAQDMILDGSIEPWNLANVNSVRHVEDSGKFAIRITEKRFGHQRPQEDQVWVEVEAGPTLHKSVPEFSLGDNGSKWQSDFHVNTGTVVPGYTSNLALDCARFAYVHSPWAYGTIDGKMLAFMADAAVFYRNDVNPLPELRKRYTGWGFEYRKGDEARTPIVRGKGDTITVDAGAILASFVIPSTMNRTLRLPWGEWL